MRFCDVKSHPDRIANETTMLFISLPSRAVSTTIPMSYLYLAAWLEKKGISSEILDIKNVSYSRNTPTLDINGILQRILSGAEIVKPKYMGFTCYTGDFNSVIKIGKLIKKRIDTKIVVGGIHPTLKPEDFFHEGSPVDIAVIGEGELALSELIEKDLNGLSLKDVAGIMYRENGAIIRTSERAHLCDLGELPLPAYDKVDMELYALPQQSLVRFLLLSGVRIFTARGCPYFCTFCANRAQKVRYRPVAAVIEEIAFLRDRYSIDGFYINDDTFCMDRERTFEFLRELKQSRIDMVWGMETRANLLDEELIISLKRAGCIQVDLGVESGSQEMLNRVKKGVRVEDIVRAFNICRRNKMRTFACFMVNMPGETETDIRESINLMSKIKATIYGINITMPHIGTKIYEDYVKPKLKPEEYDKFIFDNSFNALKDKRFRLTNHGLNEKYIYYVKFKKFRFWRLILDITFAPVYWRIFMRSRRRSSYLKQFSKIMIYKIFVYPFKLLKTVNFKFDV